MIVQSFPFELKSILKANITWLWEEIYKYQRLRGPGIQGCNTNCRNHLVSIPVGLGTKGVDNGHNCTKHLTWTNQFIRLLEDTRPIGNHFQCARLLCPRHDLHSCKKKYIARENHRLNTSIIQRTFTETSRPRYFLFGAHIPSFKIMNCYSVTWEPGCCHAASTYLKHKTFK